MINLKFKKLITKKKKIKKLKVPDANVKLK